MIPHEKELAKQLADKPFTFFAINTDRGSDVPQRLEKEGITWTNVMEGRTGGPIAKRWNVNAYPTIFVLDHKGEFESAKPTDHELSKGGNAILVEYDSPTGGDAVVRIYWRSVDVDREAIHIRSEWVQRRAIASTLPFFGHLFLPILSLAIP